jgi:hypothetical protein
MLIRPAELEAIRRGDVDVAYRRWDRARLNVGTRMRTAVGLVEATSVEVIDVDSITDDDARRGGVDSRETMLKLLAAHPERPVYRVGLRYAGPDPRVALREHADVTEDERAQLLAKLDRLDNASRHGSWTRAALEIIERRPAVRAPDLAAELGLETVVFKRDVRKLKELGLTESLAIGYRLAPRGRAVLGLVR